jgi:hypothetical protein
LAILAMAMAFKLQYDFISRRWMANLAKLAKGTAAAKIAKK